MKDRGAAGVDLGAPGWKKTSYRRPSSRLFLAASSSPESCADADCFWLLFLLFLGGMMSVGLI